MKKDDEPPDYNRLEYLSKIHDLVNEVDTALSQNTTDKFVSLVKKLYRAEAILPAVVADRSAVRMIAGRRNLLQDRIINYLKI